MKNLRLIGGAVTISALLTLAGGSVASAAPANRLAPSSVPATVTRIVIFNGRDAGPVGPKGPLTSAWTPYTEPKSITTTNDGTLVEDTSLRPVGGCPPFTGADCSQWLYSRSQAQLRDFYWDQPHGAGKVAATGMATLLNDSNAWVELPSLGQGVVSPTCLSWVSSNGVNYIHLDTKNWKWSKAGSDCISA